MMNRRAFLLSLTAGVALVFVAGFVIADELFGVITNVDVPAKKLTVQEKKTDTVVDITVNNDTEFFTKEGYQKGDAEKHLRRIAKGVEKAKEKGKAGFPARIYHEGRVATKISPAFKKKEAPKDDR